MEMLTQILNNQSEEKMSTEELKTRECPQCEGVGKEHISIKVTSCRKCHGTGVLELVSKKSYCDENVLVKTAQTFEEFKDDQNDLIDDFSDLTNIDNEKNQIHYDKETESSGIDDSLIIPADRSNEEIKRGVISMLRSFNGSELKELFPMFCRILNRNPDVISSQVGNTNEYTYYCLDDMNATQLRNAFCITRKFI